MHELFKAKPTDSISDERIIPRAARENRAWVTLDLQARREHAGRLAKHKVSVLWVTQPNDGFTAAFQFALLGRALLFFDRELSGWPGKCVHARIGSTLQTELDVLERAGRVVTKRRAKAP